MQEKNHHHLCAYWCGSAVGESGDVTMSFTLKNTGSRSEMEVAQVNADPPAAAGEPPQRLAARQKVTLAAGASKQITLTVPVARFTIWDNGWQVPAASASISAGGSSGDANAIKSPLMFDSKKLPHALRNNGLHGYV